MKIPAIVFSILIGLSIIGCNSNSSTVKTKDTPKSFSDSESVVSYLSSQNDFYIESVNNTGDISKDKRYDTSVNGQAPYAVVLTCSDSRVPVEHIFNAGIGELFVVRTAGNVVGDYELGSVEYGAEHLGAKLVVVLGHTNCGAVKAAMSGGAHGNIEKITDEISEIIPENMKDSREAEILNVKNSIDNIMSSEMMQELVHTGKTKVIGGIYDIESGKVSFLDF